MRWRRGQDSNLHSLSAGGFQDRCTTIMRPLREGGDENIAHADEAHKTARPRIALFQQMVQDLSTKKKLQATSTTKCASPSARSTLSTAISKGIPPASFAASNRPDKKTQTWSSSLKPASRGTRRSTGSSIATYNVVHSNRCRRSSTPHRTSLRSSAL